MIAYCLSQLQLISENLELVIEECWVDHQDVGRYFEEFCGTYYIPNKEKQQEYPDDLAVCTSRAYKSST